MLRQLCMLMLFSLSFVCSANESEIVLEKAHVDVTDLPSLQRGARAFMDRCAGCHSLKYLRYDSLAAGIGVVDKKGQVLNDLVKSSLMFAGDKITDPILSSLSAHDGQNWFGISPPDLSLVARLRGSDWIYTYLRSFYRDDTKLWGVNNTVFPDVAMPHVLEPLQGLQVLTSKEGEAPRFKLQEAGSLKASEFDRVVLDITNFLTYVGEPIQAERKKIGVYVLLFLGVFTIFAYLLKREYWKDVH